MSEFIEAEWFSGLRTAGAVLMYNEYDGFKCYIGPSVFDNLDADIKSISEHGAKLPVQFAAALFGDRMTSEWLRRNLWDKSRASFKYDGKNYNYRFEVTEVK